MLYSKNRKSCQASSTRKAALFGMIPVNLVTILSRTCYKNMTTNAEIFPYLTNHLLRATTVTVLSAQTFETLNIKAITGHRSDTSIESYCKRPTLNQFKEISTALTHFVSGDENQLPVNASPAAVPSRPEHELIPALPASQQMYLSRQDENYLVANEVNPGAILLWGTFKNCSFSFNINVNKT